MPVPHEDCARTDSLSPPDDVSDYTPETSPVSVTTDAPVQSDSVSCGRSESAFDSYSSALCLALRFVLADLLSSLLRVLIFQDMAWYLGARPNSLSIFIQWVRVWLFSAESLRLLCLLALLQAATGIPYLTLWAVAWTCYILVRVVPPIVWFVVVLSGFVYWSPIVRQVFRLWLEARYYTGRILDHKTPKGLVRKLRRLRSADEPSATHPQSSDVRNTAVLQVLGICDHFEWTPYFFLMTRRLLEMRDEWHGIYGAPALYLPELSFVNDAYALAAPADHLPDSGLKTAIVLIDRDYYLDMTEVFMLGLPVILYTFEPSKPCSRNDEMEYTFDNEGYLVGKVSGGREWRHQIWAYPDDMLYVARRNVLRTFKVLRYSCGGGRYIIVFLPLSSTVCFQDRSLVRRRYNFGSALVSVRGKKTYVGHVGGHVCFSLDSEMWEVLVQDIRARSTVDSIPSVSTAQIELVVTSWEPDLGSHEKNAMVNFLFSALKSLDYPAIGVTLSNTAADFSVRPKPKQRIQSFANLSPDGKGAPAKDTTGMLRVGDPIVSTGGAPERTPENTVGAIDQRCTKPQERAEKYVDVHPRYYAYVEEFIRVHVGSIVLVPCGDEVVAEHMDRPDQRRDMEAAACERRDVVRNVDQFPKVEAYIRPNDSRNIATEKGWVKYEMANFTYPVADQLKTKPWYAFGRPLSEVEKRVAAICKLAREKGWFILKTDFNRFDGTVHGFLRFFIARLYACYYPDHHDRVQEILTTRYDRVVKTSDGFRYNSGYSQLSGDNNTSIMGTNCNAFVSFSAFRDLGFDPEEAYALLGVYGGDDGLAATPNPDALITCAKELGLSLDLSVVEPPADGITVPTSPAGYVDFLARVFSPRVWYGSPDNCCDFTRTVSKFWDVDASCRNKFERLWEKSYAMVQNDARTPILGVLAKAITNIGCHIMGQDTPFMAMESPEAFMRAYPHRISYWGSIACTSSGFTNTNEDGWMWDYVQCCHKGCDPHAYMEYLQEICDSSVTAACAHDLSGTVSRKQRLVLLEQYLAPLLNLRPYLVDPPKEVVKEGHHTLIINKDDAYIVRNGENTAVPNVSDIPKVIEPTVTKGLVEQHAVTSVAVLNPSQAPYASVPPGARKCLYVAARFIQHILSMGHHHGRGCQIIYTGAYSNYTAVPIARAFAIAFPRAFAFHFFDPAFRVHDNDPGRADKEKVLAELKPIRCVNVRAVAYSDADIEKIVDRAHVIKGDKDYYNSVFWLDDAYANSSPDADLRYMVMKRSTLTRFLPRITFASIKCRDLKEPFLVSAGKITRYHTPNHELFSDVRETRLHVSETGDAVDVMALPVEEVPLAKAVSTLYRMEHADSGESLQRSESAIQKHRDAKAVPRKEQVNPGTKSKHPRQNKAAVAKRSGEKEPA